MKLLIVDDQEINLRLLRAQLEAEGHRVEQASDGIEALEALEREAFDGVVSDILMPRMDGYRLCMEVRARPTLAATPFVLYTSTYNSPGDRELAESVGADAYLTKPAPMSRLLAVLHEADSRAAAPPSSPQSPSPVFEPVMKQYNEVLIRKLEEKGSELERTYEGLLETQARLAGLISSALDAIVVVDEQRRIVLFNAAAGRMFQCAPEEAIGRPVNDFIPSRSHAIHDRHMAAYAEEADVGRRMGPRDVVAIRADGTEFPVEASISRLSTSKGQLFTAFIRDITERRRAEIALQRSEAGLRRAQDVAGLAHAVVNANGEVEERSESFADLLGLSPAELPATVEQWLALVHPDDRAALQAAVRAVRGEARRMDLEYRCRRGEEWRRMRHILEPLQATVFREGMRTFNTLQDVTEEHRAQEKIRQLNRLYAVLSAINGLIVRVADRDDLLRGCCRILTETGGFTKAWVGLCNDGVEPVRIVARAGAQDEFFDDLQQRLVGNAASGTGLLARALGSGEPAVSNDIAHDPVIVERAKLLESGARSLALLPLKLGGAVTGVVSIHAPTPGFFDSEELELLGRLAGDISFALDHLSNVEHISYLATHDELTGLANRDLFVEMLSQRLSEPSRNGRIDGIVLLDLVRFRRINETLGRDAGDQLLKQVAQRLSRIDASAARVGADVFALLLGERRSASELAREFELLAQRCVDTPFQLGSEEARMGCRIGASVYPGDGDSAELLLRNAESALREARATVRPFVFYAAGMNASVSEALALESKLRRAIEREEFVLHYQPKIRLSDRRIGGVEALIRWQDPERGLIPPMRFIPVLEETGLIQVVGNWAMNRAIADARAWQAAGTAAIRVAVNVSPLQLNQPDFVEQVAAAIGSSGGELLKLEITESVIMDDVDSKIAVLERIRDLGVKIAVDDFGTGYSSLAYISRLPINSLKIDRAFITGMTAGPQGYIIVSSIIALAHALKFIVVAEGVETEEQATLLKLLACDEAQGYLFSKPVPSERLLEMLLAERG